MAFAPGGGPISSPPPPKGNSGQPGAPGSGIPSGAMQLAGADAAAGQAAMQQQQMLEQTMMQVRQLGEAIKQLAVNVPAAADEINQIQQLLKAVVIKAAQGSPMQTPSGMAVPGNGGGA